MTAIDLIILGLATYRIASLLAEERGPFMMFDRIRWYVGVRYNENSEAIGTNDLSKGILCVWCNSVWVGALLAFVYFLWWNILWLLLPLALSALAIIAHTFVKRMEKDM